MFCHGALKGAGRRTVLYQGLDGARARQIRQQMRQAGKGELFGMFNQRPTPWGSAAYRTHPT
eukprot:10840563-Alexandrium_andersonii.AAC.1